MHEIPDLKDGASWAALEYAKNLRDPDAGRSYSSGQRMREEPQDVTICIAGISYSDKTKYRACAVMECVATRGSGSSDPVLARLTGVCTPRH